MRVRVFVRTNKVGSECSDEIEIEDDEWRTMSETDREDYLRDVVWNMAEWGYEEAAPSPPSE